MSVGFMKRIAHQLKQSQPLESGLSDDSRRLTSPQDPVNADCMDRRAGFGEAGVTTIVQGPYKTLGAIICRNSSNSISPEPS